MRDISVNKLPEKTWNRLKLNEAVVSLYEENAESEYNVEIKSGNPVLLESESKSKFESKMKSGSKQDSESKTDTENKTDSENKPNSEKKTDSENKTDSESKACSGGMGDEFDALINSFMTNEGIKGDVYNLPAGDKNVMRFNFTLAEQNIEKNNIMFAGFDCEEGSDSLVIFDYMSCRDKKIDNAGPDGYQLTKTVFNVADNASVKIVRLFRADNLSVIIDDLAINSGEKSDVNIVNIVMSGGKTFIGCKNELVGKKAVCTADICYDIGNESILDFNYILNHRGKKTESNINIKGTLDDNAKKAFRGTINFINGCAGSVGSENEDVLLISDETENKTLPIILCSEEDVEGTHGASIGNLSEEVMMYMSARGMDEEQIHELIRHSRMVDVINKVDDEELIQELAYNLDVE